MLDNHLLKLLKSLQGVYEVFQILWIGTIWYGMFVVIIKFNVDIFDDIWCKWSCIVWNDGIY